MKVQLSKYQYFVLGCTKPQLSTVEILFLVSLEYSNKQTLIVAEGNRKITITHECR